MKRSVVFLGLLLSLQIFWPQAAAQPTQKLAIVGGMLLDGYEAPPLHGAVVLVEGNRITAVGRRGQIEIPSDARIIDASGATILPGLIDLHVHLTILGHGDYDVWDAKYESRMEEVMEIAARQLLTAGVTSAVELGARIDESVRIRQRIESREIPGPRMWMSGPWLIRTERPIPEQSLYYQTRVTTPEHAAAVTEELCRQGADVIKAYTGLTLEHYKAITSAAHRHRVPVHAHLYDPDDIRNAIAGGVDVLQHVGSAGEPLYDPELVREIAVKGVPVVPTVAHRIWVFPATVAFPERLQDPRLRRDFPEEIYSDIQESLKNFPRLEYFATTPRQIFYGSKSVRQWIDSGVVMGMGTDSGTPMNFHTEALWRELKVFIDHGMAPLKVLSAATRVNARILGRGRDLGTIEPGKLADIVVVDGNPLFDITYLDRVRHVIKDGQHLVADGELRSR